MNADNNISIKLVIQNLRIPLVQPASDIESDFPHKVGALFFIHDPIPELQRLRKTNEFDDKWKDPDFPANSTSIVSTLDSLQSEIISYQQLSDTLKWRRPLPNEYCVGNDGMLGTEIKQNNVGDCWLLGTISAVASKANEDNNIISLKQWSSTLNHAPEIGCYSVRLFIEYHVPSHLKHEKPVTPSRGWAYLLCDDCIPVVTSNASTHDSTPAFCTNPLDPQELWPVFLEKAFAKWAGCYQNLRGGLQNIEIPIGTRRAQMALSALTKYNECDLKVENGEVTSLTWQEVQIMCNHGVVTTGGAVAQYGLIPGHVFSVLGVYESSPLEKGSVNMFMDLWTTNHKDKMEKVLHFVNHNKNNGVWFRFYYDGGWNGNEIGSGNEWDFPINAAEGTLKWMWYNGTETTFEPNGEIKVLKSHRVTFPAEDDGEVMVSEHGSDENASTAIAHLKDEEPVRLVKLRNPWGHGEWKGLWSDGHIAWEVFAGIKEEMKQEDHDDGIFFMQWEDFNHYFSYLMCSM